MKLFLVEVWKKSKVTFVLFSSIILLTFYCTFVQFEITPFFLWAHYSEQQSPQESYERIYVRVNGELLDLPSIARSTREMIQIPTEEFCKLKESNFENITSSIIRIKWKGKFSDEFVEGFITQVTSTKEDENKFLPWLSRYVERTCDVKVETIEVGILDIVPTYKNGKRSAKKMNLEPIASLER
mgnify:CR=1 FL=1|tara:strand:- start:3829 stop:4380 length:552 start_codon:yes stop_codon:yes gene_type:complete